MVTFILTGNNSQTTHVMRMLLQVFTKRKYHQKNIHRFEKSMQKIGLTRTITRLRTGRLREIKIQRDGTNLTGSATIVTMYF